MSLIRQNSTPELGLASGPSDYSTRSTMLALGLTEQEEAVYRALAQRPSLGGDELAVLCNLGTSEAKRAISGLRIKGLLARQPGRRQRFVVTPPDVALQGLLLQREEQITQAQQELRQAKLVASEVIRRYQDIGAVERPVKFVEMFESNATFAHRLHQAYAAASEEVLIVDKPPYYGGENNPEEPKSLARGVRWRVIYDRTALELAGRLANITGMCELGEEARISQAVPFKFAIFDRAMGYIPLAHDVTTTNRPVLAVHASALLDALLVLFELQWERSVPVRFGGVEQVSLEASASAPDKRELETLRLLAGGLTDQAIALQLGVSDRTVTRFIAAAMHQLGATTRFQLGLAAGKRSWI